MAKVADFYNYIDSIAPFSLQENWDNSGMLAGDFEKEVSKAAVVLDITAEAVEYASQLGAELIISHHPVIFKPQKSFIKGSIPYELAIRGVSAICAHTCLDCADGGVNDVLAQTLGLRNVEIFPCEESENMVRVGVMPQMMSCSELAAHIKNLLGGSVRYNETDKMIESVALCGGAGSCFIQDVEKAGIDAYITGDAGHHDFLDCTENGIALFAAGHFETENPVVFSVANSLRTAFPDTDIFVIPQQSPVKIL